MIAKETARTLGLGTNIQDAQGLPTLDADGNVPKDLGKKYGQMILAADGFAQVCSIAADVGSLEENLHFVCWSATPGLMCKS